MSDANASGPCPHLSWNELRCHDHVGTPYPIDWRTDPSRLPKLTQAFTAIRALYNLRLEIPSAFRTWAHHAAIYAGLKRKPPKGSQHLQGRALDLKPPEGVTVRAFYDAIVALAGKHPELGIRYVKGYGTSHLVHVDVRPSSQLVVEWAERE